MKALIINQYAGNKGDRAVAYFELRELAKKSNIDKIYLSTNNPSWWHQKDSIPQGANVSLIPWGWNVAGFNPRNRWHWEHRRFMRIVALPFLAFCYQKNIKIPLWIARLYTNHVYLDAVLDADIIISTGGHHLTTRFTPDLRCELFFDILTAAMYRSVTMWSQTFGPFRFQNKNLKNACIKLLSSSKLCIRDLQSEQEINTLCATPNVSFTYETVIGLENEITEYILPSKREKKVGITIYNAEARTNQKYSNYIKTMAQTADYLCENSFEVVFFPHEIKGAGINDRDCIKDIIQLCSNKRKIQFIDVDEPTAKHLKAISECSMFIGHKTHSVVFALTVGTPLLAIAYHSKTYDFLKQYGLTANVIDESKLTFDLIRDKINEIIANMDAIGQIQITKSREYGSIVRKHFSEITKYEKC